MSSHSNILSGLRRSLKAVTDREAVSTVGRIAEKSISFSRDNIKNFLKFLNVTYGKARDDQALIPLIGINTVRSSRARGEVVVGVSAEDLFVKIDSLISMGDDHLSSCRAAYQFKERKKLMDLLRLHGSAERRSMWSSVSHLSAGLAAGLAYPNRSH